MVGKIESDWGSGYVLLCVHSDSVEKLKTIYCYCKLSECLFTSLCVYSLFFFYYYTFLPSCSNLGTFIMRNIISHEKEFVKI